ncbi:hypothetical protein [uncultured Clostridium sp.]|uniref:hypothetical protein n=1 Tax=uncultured Clostridium sp. TaxID=59620 RepID=UPI002601EC1A|nr:hypothetical protein [uncultured Clostridium sp.]
MKKQQSTKKPLNKQTRPRQNPNSKSNLKTRPRTRTNSKRKTKTIRKFNIFKFLKSMFIIVAIIIGINFLISVLTPKAAPVKNTNPAIPTVPLPKPLQLPAPPIVPVKPTLTPQDYNQKQEKLIESIFRFNQNIYMTINGDNFVNLYPDSQNAVNALSSNLSIYATKLSPSLVQSDSTFLSELIIKNNAFINDAITYNKAALTKNISKEALAKLHKPLLASYNAINQFMNSNINLFK